MSANEQLERDLKAFLDEEDSRLAALYRRLPQPEPDARVDAAVLAMAHRALNPELVATPRQEAIPRHRPARWLPAIGAAAGVVFAAGIAWRLGSDNAQTAGERAMSAVGSKNADVFAVRPIDAPATAQAQKAPEPAAADELANSAAVSTGRVSAPGASAGAKTESARIEPPAAARPALRMAPAASPPPAASAAPPAPAAAAGAAADLGKVDNATRAKRAAEAFPGRATAAPEMDAVERKQAIAAGAWQTLHEAETRPSEPKAKAADSALNGTAQAPAQSAAGAGEAMNDAAPAAATREAGKAPQDKDLGAARADVETATPSVAPARERATPAAPVTASSSGAAEVARDAQPGLRKAAVELPGPWILRIQQMLRDGKRDEALKSLAEFKRQYPDQRLPDDLRNLKQ